MRSHWLAAVVALSALGLGCHAMAESGDAAEVIRLCGTPTAEHQGVSPVTNTMERDLSYGSVLLHFEPVEGGWRFLSGWYDHLPLTEAMVENRMPCFREAIAASAAGQPRDRAGFEDPAVKNQTFVPASETSTFGVPHLRLILILAVIVAICFFLPRPRQRGVHELDVEPMRYRRRPMLDRFMGRGSGTGLDV